MTHATPVLTVLRDADGEPAFAVLPWANWLALAERLGAPVDDDEADDLAAFAEARTEDDGFRLPLAQLRLINAGEHPIRVLRLWRGLSQIELAERMQSAPNYISQIETNARKGLRRAEDFGRALDVPPDLIRGWLKA